MIPLFFPTDSVQPALFLISGQLASVLSYHQDPTSLWCRLQALESKVSVSVSALLLVSLLVLSGHSVCDRPVLHGACDMMSKVQFSRSVEILKALISFKMEAGRCPRSLRRVRWRYGKQSLYMYQPTNQHMLLKGNCISSNQRTILCVHTML